MRKGGFCILDQEKIARINELAAIAKERELTQEELEERTVLRNEYLEASRRNFKAQLDNIEIVD